MFEQYGFAEKLGERIGFVFSYLLFTTIVYLIFIFTRGIGSWGFIHIAGITLIIAFIGAGIKRLLR